MELGLSGEKYQGSDSSRAGLKELSEYVGLGSGKS